MRNAPQVLRRIAVIAAVGVLGAVPVAAALMSDPFGSVELVDKDWRPGDLYQEPVRMFGADGDGNAVWGSFARSGPGDQMAVLERCGSSPATWKRTLLGAPDGNFVGVGVKVAHGGTAMAVWRTGSGQNMSYFSSTRPHGGAWGAPETIVTGATTTVGFALSDAGDAVAVWNGVAPNGTVAAMRPAGGSWQTPETIVAAVRGFEVAMSASGDAVILTRAAGPARLESFYRPAGGPWQLTPQLAIMGNSVDLSAQFMIEFDGLGRAVAIADWRQLHDTILTNVRSGGGWGTQTERDDDGNNPQDPAYDIRVLRGLVRHPSGAVAVWLRRSTNGNFDDDIVVSRLAAGGWDPPRAFDLPNRFAGAAAATNDAGEILLAGQRVTRPGALDVDEIWGTVASSLTAAWPADMTRLSPAGSTATLYRNVVAAGGGSGFLLGWGVHGANNQRSEVVATEAPAVNCDGTVAPPPTPTPTASPDPLPAPPSPPPPPVTPTPPPPAGPATPTAIASFTNLPPASRCVRGRKLTVRFKKPPKGYTVKSITVKVNAKRVATLSGKKLSKPLYLRKLPRASFTVTVSIKLAKGKGLTERRRYTGCK